MKWRGGGRKVKIEFLNVYLISYNKCVFKFKIQWGDSGELDELKWGDVGEDGEILGSLRKKLA